MRLNSSGCFYKKVGSPAVAEETLCARRPLPPSDESPHPPCPPRPPPRVGGASCGRGVLPPLGVSASWGRVCGAAALVGEPPLPPAPVSHTLGPLRPGPTGPPLPRSRRRASPPTEADPPVCRLQSKAAHLFSLKRLAGNRCLMFVEWTNERHVHFHLHTFKGGPQP